jgi:hypothetical protein
MFATQPPAMTKRKHRRSSSISILLPDDNGAPLHLSQTPWFRAISRTFRPLPPPDASCWTWLEYELQLFQLYVQLQHKEVCVREDVIMHIEKTVTGLFATPPYHGGQYQQQQQVSHRGRWGNFDTLHPAVTLQAFGSFASPPVCCFLSDLDLAVWGVILPAAPQEDQELKEVSPSVAKLPSKKLPSRKRTKTLNATKLAPEHLENIIDLTSDNDHEPEIIDLTMNDDHDGDNSDDEDDSNSSNYPHPTIPSGDTLSSKEQVSPIVSALRKLRGRLLGRKAFGVKQSFVRQNARVPIINLVTSYGFQVDISIGGQTGMDTSSFANQMVASYRRYVSMSKVCI